MSAYSTPRPTYMPGMPSHEQAAQENRERAMWDRIHQHQAAEKAASVTAEVVEAATEKAGETAADASTVEDVQAATKKVDSASTEDRPASQLPDEDESPSTPVQNPPLSGALDLTLGDGSDDEEEGKRGRSMERGSRARSRSRSDSREPPEPTTTALGQGILARYHKAKSEADTGNYPAFERAVANFNPGGAVYNTIVRLADQGTSNIDAFVDAKDMRPGWNTLLIEKVTALYGDGFHVRQKMLTSEKLTVGITLAEEGSK